MSAYIADLADCVIAFGEEVEVSRSLPSPVHKGRRTGRPEDKTFSASLSIQSLSTRELEQLPEGMRNSGVVRVFSDTELLTVSTSECRVADRFVCGGVSYQVQMVEDWNRAAGYYSCLATRLGQ